jgi:hypothetical protein
VNDQCGKIIVERMKPRIGAGVARKIFPLPAEITLMCIVFRTFKTIFSGLWCEFTFPCDNLGKKSPAQMNW